MSSKPIGPLFEAAPSTKPLRSFADLKRPPQSVTSEDLRSKSQEALFDELAQLLAQQSAERRELAFSSDDHGDSDGD